MLKTTIMTSNTERHFNISIDYCRIYSCVNRKFWMVYWLCSIFVSLLVVGKFVLSANEPLLLDVYAHFILAYMAFMLLLIALREKLIRNYRVKHSVEEFYILNNNLCFRTNGGEVINVALSESRFVIRKILSSTKKHKLKYEGLNYVVFFNQEEYYFPMDGFDNLHETFKNCKTIRPPKYIRDLMKKLNVENISSVC